MADANRTCSLDDCDGIVIARRLCGKHYARARTSGVLPPKARVTPEGTCNVDGCERPNFCKGHCSLHDHRLRRTGTTDDPVVRRGSEAPQWVGDDASYRTVHSRLVAQRGKAAEYTCVDCGSPAREWSYDHTDPNAMEDARGGEYSSDLDRYQPRCRSCHFAFDQHPWAY